MKNIKKIKKANKGITLIALVITIIVLLILAGVAIATLTGENGVLTKANKAKTETDRASAREKVQIAVMGSYGANGTIDINELKENLKKTEGVTGADSITKLPAKVTADGYEVNIDENGKVTIEGEATGGNDTLTPTSTLEEAIAKNAPLSTTENTILEDKYKNIIVLPAGFKINSESADNVTGGVVIEDVSHANTVGSEFVWIPVGTVYTNETGTASETINLSRYTFDTTGTPTSHGVNPIAVNSQFEPCDPNDEDYMASFEEKAESDLGNTVAINIEQFKTKAIKNHGYYIGRYEARTVETAERTEASKDNGAGVTVKKDGFIYNWVTQPKAAQLSQNMYSDSNFTSDLINSYAWDTAIVFLQTFGTNKKYSRQSSLNTSFANKGTNNLTENQDKICNIWDMASNDAEMTTETSSGSDFHCTNRGDHYIVASDYAAIRGYYGSVYADDNVGFRLLLYL